MTVTMKSIRHLAWCATLSQRWGISARLGEIPFWSDCKSKTRLKKSIQGVQGIVGSGPDPLDFLPQHILLLFCGLYICIFQCC